MGVKLNHPRNASLNVEGLLIVLHAYDCIQLDVLASSTFITRDVIVKYAIKDYNAFYNSCGFAALWNVLTPTRGTGERHNVTNSHWMYTGQTLNLRVSSKCNIIVLGNIIYIISHYMWCNKNLFTILH